MTKRAVKKPTRKKSASGFGHSCFHKGCKKGTVMMRRSRKDPDVMEHYCAGHWKSDVEAKNPEAYIDKPRVQPKKKAVRIKRAKK